MLTLMLPSRFERGPDEAESLKLFFCDSASKAEEVSLDL